MKHSNYSVLRSVMEKLPATSYVRLVDIWLMFVQLVPFVQVGKYMMHA